MRNGGNSSSKHVLEAFFEVIVKQDSVIERQPNLAYERCLATRPLELTLDFLRHESAIGLVRRDHGPSLSMTVK